MKSKVILLALLLPLWAIGSEESLSIQLTRDGKLPYDPSTTGFAHITFYNAVLGRLIRLQTNLTIEPSLLEDAHWDFKNRNYVLKLRPGLKFHNGRPVTIEDLDFSLVRFFLSKKRVDPVAFLRHIEGLETLSPGSAYRPWAVSGIQKVDDRTITVKLSAPNPVFLYSLAEGWVSLVPREELEEDYVTWKRFPVGAGPYRVEKLEGARVSVVRDDSSPAGSPLAPARVVFVSDPQHLPDVVGFVSGDVVSNSLKKVYGAGPIGFTGIFFNSNNPLGSNIHFRRAVDCIVQREEFGRINADFSPLDELLTHGFYGRIGSPQSCNLHEAKSELAKVPAELLRNSIPAHWFSGRSKMGSTDKAVIDLVTKQLAGFGLKVAFGGSPNPTFAPEDDRTVLRVDDRGTAFADPLIIFRAFEKPAFLSPFFVGDSVEFNHLLSEAARAESLDVKASSIFNLSQFFQRNHIIVPLYERKSVYWVNPKKVADLGVQTGITFDLQRVRIRK